MEHAITGDFALVKGWKADKAGNVTFRYLYTLKIVLRRDAIDVLSRTRKVDKLLQVQNVHVLEYLFLQENSQKF